MVVNNNAAATLLMLAALAAGREVIVSRGELVEIGGGFRVPDVMAQSGALLREVGTTNRTRVGDYAAAIGGRHGAPAARAPVELPHRGIHRAAVARRNWSALGRELRSPGGRGPRQRLPRACPARRSAGRAGRRPRRRAAASRTASRPASTSCCFSGDKLLGGPQAGIIVGRAALVDAVRRHPLMRALRVDKLTYAALEATLGEYAAGRASRTVPGAADDPR